MPGVDSGALQSWFFSSLLFAGLVHKYPTNTEATSKVVSLSDISVTPLFAFLLCPLYDTAHSSNKAILTGSTAHSSNKAIFTGSVALQSKPDRRGYLPVRKAALLGVQSGAAAMCWVSFTPSFARRSMFGVLQVQPMPPGITQRVFQGSKKL